MAREIKFRAWHIKTKKYFPLDGSDSFSVFEDDAFIVEQFTGLRDRDGIPIYEGDVLRVPGVATLRDVGPVISYRGAFGVELEGKKVRPWYLCNFHEHDMEILGNIHENPELLKEAP